MWKSRSQQRPSFGGYEGMNDVSTEKSYWLGYQCLKTIWMLTLRPFLRIRVTGTEHIPNEGPFMCLANHTTWLDPAWIMVLCGRPVHFLAAAHWFNAPILGSILRTVGAIPKQKFTKDRNAVMQLVSLYERGKPVGQFPEGERNWDGKTLPVLPGVGKMILRLNAKVLIARVEGGHQFFPRWSPRFRWAPLHVTFLPVHTFAPERTPEEVEAELNRLLAVDPDACPVPKWAWGWRLADGLPNLLWACPQCFCMEGLEVTARGDGVQCRACGGAWRVGLEGALRCVAPGAGLSLTIMTAQERIWARFGVPPVADPVKREQTGGVLEAPGCTLRPVRGEGVVAQGRLRLEPERLWMGGEDGEVRWETPLNAVKSISIEGSKILTFRVQEQHLALELGAESRVKWAYFLKQWCSTAPNQLG